MRRDLPPRPHIDHLKKQAKDLLDAHKRAEPAALERIREALPAFGSWSHDAIAQAAFALHDAQSAIAREYGFASWRELRAEVASRALESVPFSDDNLRALMQRLAPMGAPTPTPEVLDALRQVRSPQRRLQVAEARRSPLPERLPLLPVRDALLLPTSVAPFYVVRPASLAALEVALGQTPSTLALFAQRVDTDDTVTLERLHPTGCQALVHAYFAASEGRSVVVLEALRPITLAAVEPSAQSVAQLARIGKFDVDTTDAANEIATLEQELRSFAVTLSAALPNPENARALLEQFDETALADIVVANLQLPVPDKAAFASEPRLVERLRRALQMVQQLTAAPG